MLQINEKCGLKIKYMIRTTQNLFFHRTPVLRQRPRATGDGQGAAEGAQGVDKGAAGKQQQPGQGQLLRDQSEGDERAGGHVPARAGRPPAMPPAAGAGERAVAAGKSWCSICLKIL
jgi:hypothetical protein